jgi:signal transduction histidine kinase
MANSWGEFHWRSSAAVLACVAGSVAVGVTVWYAFGVDPPTSIGPAAWPSLLTAALAFMLCAWWPTSVALAVLSISCFYYHLSGQVNGPLVIAFGAALYAVAVAGLLRRAVALGVAAVTVLTIGGAAAGFHGFTTFGTVLLVEWLVAVVALGDIHHSRAEKRREVARRIAAVEEGRVEHERRLAGEERLRIARELHDALGHYISLISVQATAALHGMRTLPAAPEPAAALDAIKDTSGKALRELRTVLDILRHTAETGPPAGLDRLAVLVEDARSAGFDVRTHVEPAPRPLAPEIDLAAYRIAQEALTNVTRHAEASSVDLRIRYRRGELDLEVWDNGTGDRHRDGMGNGLRGMAERAGLLGGQVTAGPAPEGGFRVNARLPLDVGG